MYSTRVSFGIDIKFQISIGFMILKQQLRDAHEYSHLFAEILKMAYILEAN